MGSEEIICTKALRQRIRTRVGAGNRLNLRRDALLHVWLLSGLGSGIRILGTEPGIYVEGNRIRDLVREGGPEVAFRLKFP